MSGVWRRQGRFREDRRLTISNSEAQSIRDKALEEGFSRAGFVGLSQDASTLDSVPGGAESSILVCCLSCHRSEPDDLSTPDDPHGLIAPFARRNYYKTAIRMLRRLTVRIEEDLGIPGKSMRLFCNSRLPEKPLCVLAGLAWLANNGLCIVPGLGSLFVIAGMVIPATLSEEHSAEGPLPNHCGSCRLCIDSCPTGAIVKPGMVERAKCLQDFAARDQVLPEELLRTWGSRLYGCQECQSVCPYNRTLAEESLPAVGGIGPSVSLRWFLSLDKPQVRELFHGTAMGLSWISKDALVRNAIIAAGASGNAALVDCVAPFVASDSAGVRQAAIWALKKLSQRDVPGA